MSGKSVARSLIIAVAITPMLFATAARADFRIERELALAPGGAFVLEADSGSVELRGVDRAGARIVVTSPRDDVEERYSFAFEERGADAVVRVERRGGWVGKLFSGGDYRLRFAVEVPLGANVDIETAGGFVDASSLRGRVDLSSSGGKIEVADIDGDVVAHTSGGAVAARDVRGDVRLETSGGSVRAEGIAGDATLKTSGGSVEVHDVGGAIEAHTSGGPVRASFAAGNASGGTLSTSGGGITATVDPGVALDIDAHTSGGRVTVDLPLTARGSSDRNTVRGELNGGGALLKLRSSGGSIRVRGG